MVVIEFSFVHLFFLTLSPYNNPFVLDFSFSFKVFPRKTWSTWKASLSVDSCSEVADWFPLSINRNKTDTGYIFKC